MSHTTLGLANFNYFIFDLDGVIYKGDQLIDGAVDTLNLLEKLDKRFLFVTNHTKYTKSELVGKLRNLGVKVVAEQLLTASDAAIEYIKREKHYHSPIKVHLIGCGGIVGNFRAEGFELTEDCPDYVVIAWDPKVDYDTLKIAARNVREGAVFIVTSPDRYIPSERGLELGFGSIGASIAYATGREPTYIGKPYPPMLESAISLMGANHEETVIVGDTLETDIRSQRLAHLGGSVLVLTGNTTEKDVKALPEDEKPSFVLNSVKDIQKHFSYSVR
jgi:4-nitrophenyl phosphatase